MKGELFDAGLGQFITLPLPDWKWLNKALKKPLGFEARTLLYEKNIYFRDHSQSEGATALQPVLGRAGNWVADDGTEIEGLELEGTRSCYPFTAKPTYLIDWGDGTTQTTKSTGVIRHDWTTPGPRLIKVRLVSDEAGRRFRTGTWAWTRTTARVGLTPAVDAA